MEAPFRQYFESMPCYVTVQDRDLRLIHANRRFREHFGDWEGRRCHQVYKHRSEPCEDCPVERTFRDGECHRSEELVECLDGRKVSVIVYTTPIRDEAGAVEAVLEMSTDITQIKRLEKQLRQSQERYRLLFEAAPCYISIQDRDLKIVEANKRFREDFGSLLGCPCYEVYKHRDEECIPCPVQQTFADGQVHRSEELVTSKQGDRINTLVYSAPLHGDNGEIEHVMEMSTNVTPIRELQSQLESMGILISSISHGIKGLLTGLDGGTYLVNTGLAKNKPERVTEGWEMVQRNVERIRSMVMNILYYAKEREPDWETLCAGEVVEDVARLVRGKAQENGIAFHCHQEGEVGELEADAQALRALLVNLVENSFDACRADTGRSEHRVSLTAKGFTDQVQFEVADDGIGMDRETRNKAFSLFFSSKGMAGTGLGLFISGNIAKKHGGEIVLESEPGRGTRFCVTIPRQRSAPRA